MKKFETPFGIKKPPMKKVFKWKINALFSKKRPKVIDDYFKLKVNFLNKIDLNTKSDFIIWIGHAAYYIQIVGLKILTDPIFYNLPFIPRFADIPINPKDLEPDIILISHGHYDHLDIKSLEILDIYKKQIKIIMPLSLSSYLKKDANIQELPWWDEYSHGNIEIICTPASHWHRRGAFDFNKALWCSFIIKSNNKNIFFAGDTALNTHFDEIQKQNIPIDIALMPIGAYLPVDIMKDSHMNPLEALKATNILKAKTMIPYHYGTFKLSDEPIGEPHSWINNLSKSSDINIKILDVGELYNF